MNSFFQNYQFIFHLFIYLFKGISCFISSNLKYMWITFHIFKVETCLQMLSLWRKTKTKIFFSQKFEYWSLLCKKPLNSFLQSPFSSCTTRKETKSTRIFKNRKKKEKKRKFTRAITRAAFTLLRKYDFSTQRIAPCRF